MVTDDARCSRRYDTALRAWKERWLVLDGNGASFVGSGVVQLDMPYVRRPKKRE